MSDGAFSNTMAALEIYDKGAADRGFAWGTAEDEWDAKSCFAADDKALELVRRAFHEDTKGKNTWDQAKMADLAFMRQMVERHGG